jgi:type II secretory pathway predicted ATPase ExeA
MYLDHYRLHEKPFEIFPDLKFIWLGEKHKAALDALRRAILKSEGIVRLTGEAGTGKSTFLSGVARFLSHPFQCIQIADPSVSGINFFGLMADAFGIESRFARGEEVLDCLRRFSRDTFGNSRRVVLLVDDAHRLSLKPLQQLRILANHEQGGRSLVSIVLAGPPLQCDHLLLEHPTLSQTVAMSYSLQPLTQTETAEYIRHRLHVAGAKTDIFTSSAMAEIFHLSGGVARLINLICDNALMTGYVRNAPFIGPSIVLDSKVPGHRLVHGLCELDKELSAQNSARLPAQRPESALAFGASASKKGRSQAPVPRLWQRLLKRFGLRPLTVKGAMFAPILLMTLLGICGHYYSSNEDEDLPFKSVQIHPKPGDGGERLFQPEPFFNAPSGIGRNGPAAEVQAHGSRAGREAVSAFSANEDPVVLHGINRLRDEVEVLSQRFQTAFDSMVQLEQRLWMLEQVVQIQKDNSHRVMAEALIRESEIKMLQRALATFENQQLLLEEELKNLRGDRAKLKKQESSLRGDKGRATSSVDPLRAPFKAKRSAVRPEGKGPVQPVSD